LRRVLAAIHIAIELERVGDHAAGIAILVERLVDDPPYSSYYKLPKMASRAQRMIRESIQAFVESDVDLAEAVIQEDNKMDKHYGKLVRHGMVDMHDDDYIRRANYLLWAGHGLERIGDRATNIAERVIFTVTGHYAEVEPYYTGALDDDDLLGEIED
jgi:phosphate transport system protein